jgi:hypothetical protein
MAVPTASLTLSGHTLISAGLLTDIDDGTKANATASPRIPVGTRAFDNVGNEYIYLKGVASTAAGDWVLYNPSTGVTTRTTANTAATGLLAVAMAATVASTWGWYQIAGLTSAVCALTTDAAADGKSISNGASGANGRLLPGPTTTKNVFNAVCVGAAASNVGTAAIMYPFMFGTATI